MEGSPPAGNGAGTEPPTPTPAPTAPRPQDTPPDERVFLTREQVLAAKDLTEEDIYVEEWGGWIKVRAFSKGVQLEIRERATVDDEVQQAKLQMFSFLEGVVQPEFTLDDQDGLRDKNALAFDGVLKVIFRISGMAADEGEAEAKEAEFREGSE